MPNTTKSLACTCLLAFGLLFAPGEDAARNFRNWFRDYKKGEILLYQPSSVPLGKTANGTVRYFKKDHLEEMDALLDALAVQNDLEATKLLIEAASFRFHRNGDTEIEKHYEKQPWILRAHALEALKRITDPRSVKWLRDRCLDSTTGWEAPFRRILAVELFGSDRALNDPALLKALLSDRDPRVREKTLQSLGRVGGITELEAVIGLLDDEAPSVKVAAVETMGAILEAARKDHPVLIEEALAHLAGYLDDGPWPVQESILSLMERFRTPRSIPLLIAFLEKDGDLRERIVQRTAEVLRSLTGARILDADAGDWREWWSENRDTFQMSAEPSPALKGFQLNTPSFFNIPVNSDNVFFILDISGSMRAPLTLNGGESKLQRAREELTKTLDALDSEVRFNVILFNDAVFTFSDHLVKAAEEEKKIARRFFEKAEADDGTNIFNALNAALDIKSMGLVDRLGEDIELDTIFLLSDGVPTSGIVIDPEEIVRIVTRANALSKIKINTIYLGEEPSRFMFELAENNFGQYIHIR
jgi:HEAT repeat protein